MKVESLTIGGVSVATGVMGISDSCNRGEIWSSQVFLLLSDDW